MAVTNQESTQYENAFTDAPRNMNPVSVWGGKVQSARFSHTQSGAGDATSDVALVRLPAGRVRVLLNLSDAYVNWTTGSATLDLGWGAYTGLDGVAVAANPDGLCDGIDVESAGLFNFGANSVAAVKADGAEYEFVSSTGVTIYATSQDQVLAASSTIAGRIVYVCD